MICFVLFWFFLFSCFNSLRKQWRFCVIYHQFFSSVSSFYYLLLLLSTKPYYWCVRACVPVCICLIICAFIRFTQVFFFFLHGFELIYVFNHLPFWWLCQVLCVESLLVPHSITFSFRYIVFIQLLSAIFFSPSFSRTVNVIGKQLNFFSKQNMEFCLCSNFVHFAISGICKNEMCYVQHTHTHCSRLRMFGLWMLPSMEPIYVYSIAFRRPYACTPFFYYACVKLTDNPK